MFIQGGPQETDSFEEIDATLVLNRGPFYICTEINVLFYKKYTI